MEFKELKLVSEEGVSLLAKVPASLPSQERAEVLRALYNEHVKPLEGHWKGPCEAQVPAALAADVAEAMEFMGSLVDSRKPIGAGGWVKLFSKGYWAHGF